MTVTTAHPGHHHISATTAGLAFAGALLAGAAGFGIGALVLDSDPLPVPADDTPAVTNGGPAPQPFGGAGTNREDRALMHRG